MKFYVRILSTPVVALVLLLAGTATLQAQSGVWTLPDGPAAPLACEDGDQPSGARYRICLPETGWNHELFVYAHSYVAVTEPVGLPEDQLVVGGFDISQIVTGQGFAFAASSYRSNGLVIQEGIADLVELVQLFTDKYGPPRRVLLVGVSEGGVMTALATERFPAIFNGGMALCGPYGSFQKQVDYLGNFRAVFDYFLPGLMPPTPIDVPQPLIDTWETSYYSTTVQPAIVDPANAISVTQVLSVTGASIDAANPATREQTFERLLWYNVFSTNDGKAKLGGNPFDNSATIYAGSNDDAALNAAIFRTTADLAARQTISGQYETTGKLAVPLITLHTTGDPVIPYWHAVLYGDKVAGAGSTAFYEHRKVTAYGHCSFTAFDLLPAFTALTQRAPYRPALYLPVVVAP